MKDTLRLFMGVFERHGRLLNHSTGARRHLHRIADAALRGAAAILPFCVIFVDVRLHVVFAQDRVLSLVLAERRRVDLEVDRDAVTTVITRVLAEQR